MVKCKASGLDGPPAEFHLKFCHVLGQDLVDILNSCYAARSLSLSQCRGIISFFFKKGEQLDMQNCHPISLLNVDYKLAVRAIAARLLKVIHLVVVEDQTCGVLGRYIGENAAFLHYVCLPSCRSRCLVRRQSANFFWVQLSPKLFLWLFRGSVSPLFLLIVLWLTASWAGYNLSCFLPRLCVLLCCAVMSFLPSLHLNLLWFLVFLFTC